MKRISKLSLLVTILSLVVIGESVFLMNRIVPEKELEELPAEIESKIEDQSRKDLTEFNKRIEEKGSQQVDFWMKKKEGYQNKVILMLESRRMVNTVKLKLKFDPKEIRITDMKPETEEIKISCQKENCRKNVVWQDEGMIELVFVFENGFLGKNEIGDIQFERKNGRAAVFDVVKAEDLSESFAILQTGEGNSLKTNSRFIF